MTRRKPIGLKGMISSIVVGRGHRCVLAEPLSFHVCKRLSAAPDELIFIDDRLANVAGARRRGMWAIEFSGLADVRGQIDEIMDQQGT